MQCTDEYVPVCTLVDAMCELPVSTCWYSIIVCFVMILDKPVRRWPSMYKQFKGLRHPTWSLVIVAEDKNRRLGFDNHV